MKDCLEVDLLKLGLQGYELVALKGCGKLLESIKIIAIEIEFIPLYDGQPLFGDIDVYLRAQGFRMLNLYELYTHPDGQLTAGDAVYLNSKYF
ncbi:MAG: FkbM family methyltransferase [Cycloclasticus sp.]|nr:FkbM family methyltransferase [Cycloclasticus sp.]